MNKFFPALLRRSQPVAQAASVSKLASSGAMHSRYGTWLRNHLSAYMLCLVAAAAMLTPGFARAGCTVETPLIAGPMPLSGIYTVPRDLPVGTVIASLLLPDPAPVGTELINCIDVTGVQEVVTTSTPHGPREPTYKTFPTNIPGIGVRFYNPSGSAGNGYPVSAPYNVSTARGVILTVSHPYGLQFVKVAAVTGSGTVQATDVPSWQFDANMNVGFYKLLSWTPSGSIEFIDGSCITPDVEVDLGRHHMSEFTGSGYTTTAVDFDIKLNSCPAGMNSITYRIDPATTVQIAAQSVVALDATSTATGVGIQLLDGAGAAHPLGAGTDRIFSGYNATTGGSFTIPLKARYYQTGPSVAPGKANTTMMFTMTYL
ncbi:MAG TPA: fimbrial protein [Lysobacter sp.]